LVYEKLSNGHEEKKPVCCINSINEGALRLGEDKCK